MSNLRPAPAGLTPVRVERLIAFLDGDRPARARDGAYPFIDHRTVAQIGAAQPFPQDASVAASGRTAGDVQRPQVAAEEAGRDTPKREQGKD